jgi:hypothetical protein
MMPLRRTARPELRIDEGHFDRLADEFAPISRKSIKELAATLEHVTGVKCSGFGRPPAMVSIGGVGGLAIHSKVPTQRAACRCTSSAVFGVHCLVHLIGKDRWSWVQIRARGG